MITRTVYIPPQGLYRPLELSSTMSQPPPALMISRSTMGLERQTHTLFPPLLALRQTMPFPVRPEKTVPKDGWNYGTSATRGFQVKEERVNEETPTSRFSRGSRRSHNTKIHLGIWPQKAFSSIILCATRKFTTTSMRCKDGCRPTPDLSFNFDLPCVYSLGSMM